MSLERAECATCGDSREFQVVIKDRSLEGNEVALICACCGAATRVGPHYGGTSSLHLSAGPASEGLIYFPYPDVHSLPPKKQR